MPESPLNDGQEELQLPLWYREDRHRVTGAGIVRRSDEALLDDEGQPQSQALRVAEAAEAKKQAKKEAVDAGK